MMLSNQADHDDYSIQTEQFYSLPIAMYDYSDDTQCFPLIQNNQQDNIPPSFPRRIRKKDSQFGKKSNPSPDDAEKIVQPPQPLKVIKKRKHNENGGSETKRKKLKDFVWVGNLKSDDTIKPIQADSPFKDSLANKLNLDPNSIECKPFETFSLPSIIDKNYFVVDKEGCSQLALLPNYIPQELCKIIEEKCRRISKLRTSTDKTSFYAGWWTKSQPMGYMCKDNETPIGKILNEIVELISDTCRNLMKLCNEKVYLKMSELKEEKLFAPCICLNVLEPNLESRITRPHFDRNDVGVSTLFYFGDYSGGNLNVSHGGSESTIVTRPGDALILRGNYFKHGVQEIGPGVNQARYSLVFFAHKTHFLKKKYELSPAIAKKAFVRDHPDYVPQKKMKELKMSTTTGKTKKKETHYKNVESIYMHAYAGQGCRLGYRNYLYQVKIGDQDKVWESYEFIPKQMVASYWKSIKKTKKDSSPLHKFKFVTYIPKHK